MKINSISKLVLLASMVMSIFFTSLIMYLAVASENQREFSGDVLYSIEFAATMFAVSFAVVLPCVWFLYAAIRWLRRSRSSRL